MLEMLEMLKTLKMIETILKDAKEKRCEEKRCKRKKRGEKKRWPDPTFHFIIMAYCINIGSRGRAVITRGYYIITSKNIDNEYFIIN